MNIFFETEALTKFYEDNNIKTYQDLVIPRKISRNFFRVVKIIRGVPNIERLKGYKSVAISSIKEKLLSLYIITLGPKYSLLCEYQAENPTMIFKNIIYTTTTKFNSNQYESLAKFK